MPNAHGSTFVAYDVSSSYSKMFELKNIKSTLHRFSNPSFHSWHNQNLEILQARLYQQNNSLNICVIHVACGHAAYREYWAYEYDAFDHILRICSISFESNSYCNSQISTVKILIDVEMARRRCVAAPNNSFVCLTMVVNTTNLPQNRSLIQRL